MSTICSHGDWEHIILTNNYQFVYFDGLNRYYLAKEKYELEKYTKINPSCLPFIRIKEYQYEQKIASYTQKISGKPGLDRTEPEKNETRTRGENLDRTKI